jgi:hypothetical protein
MYFNRNMICLRILQKQALQESVHDLNLTQQHSMLYTISSSYSRFFIKAEKKTVAISTLVSSSRTLSHPTVASPINTPYLLPTPLLSSCVDALSWNPSAVPVFQDWVHLPRCHVAVTRVHHRFQLPSPRHNHHPRRLQLKSIPIQPRVNMVQVSLVIPKRK